MTHASFLSIKKLSDGSGHVLAAARHNKRAIQAEQGADSHINSLRSRLNYSLCGEPTPEAISALARRRMNDAGIVKLRKDAVRCIEVLFSLPFASSIDQRQYFERCTQWAGERFGHDNLLSSDVHLDEACPHCHVLILPLRDGRMMGSDMVGGRAQLIATRKHFHDNVATLYGLSLEPRLRGVAKTALAAAVTKRLLSDSDQITRSLVWQLVRDAIARDPAPFALALNVELPSPTQKFKSVVAIFTGTGKETSEDRKPIGFARPQTSNPKLCRVRPTFTPALSPDPSELVRVRDDEFSSNQYDMETGEIIPEFSDRAFRGDRATLLSVERIA